MPIGNTPYFFNKPVAQVITFSQAMGGVPSQVVTLPVAFTGKETYEIFFSDNANKLVPGNIGVIKLSPTQFQIQTVDGSNSSLTIIGAAVGY